MFYVPTLIESRHPRATRGAVGGGAASFVLHAALIAAAVYATLSVTRTVERPKLIVNLPLLREQAPPPPAELSRLAPLPAFATVEIPTAILTEIPPPSRAPFDPTRFSGIGVEVVAPVSGDVAARATERADDVYDEAMVEELPERVGGVLQRYPPMLLAAHISGEVVVECIVDTLGRVESGSIRIVRSTHRLFGQAATDAVATWTFRPGTIAGRAVRARVTIPVRFQM